jgi:hypothetical protein
MPLLLQLPSSCVCLQLKHHVVSSHKPDRRCGRPRMLPAGRTCHAWLAQGSAALAAASRPPEESRTCYMGSTVS